MEVARTYSGWREVKDANWKGERKAWDSLEDYMMNDGSRKV
jgi:hypothetical protein